jgi:hypothetical protein
VETLLRRWLCCRTRNQLYDELAELAGGVGADRAAVREQLRLTEGGTHVTQVQVQP